MKKLKLPTVLLLSIVALTGCNYKMFEFQYQYDSAEIKLQNGEIIRGKIEEWRDYEGEQLQIKIDGVTYLVNSYNVTMFVEDE